MLNKKKTYFKLNEPIWNERKIEIHFDLIFNICLYNIDFFL